MFELYGSAVGVHNPREYQYVDLRGPGAQQGTGAGVRGGAGGQDIVDQYHAAALDIGGTLGCDVEGALHTARALRPRIMVASFAEAMKAGIPMVALAELRGSWFLRNHDRSDRRTSERFRGADVVWMEQVTLERRNPSTKRKLDKPRHST